MTSVRQAVAVALLVGLLQISAQGQNDASTPQAAAASLVRAVQAGDADSIRRLFLAESDLQADLAQAFAELIVAGKRLEKAAAERFGPEGQPIAEAAVPDPMVERIQSARVEPAGEDAALLQVPDHPRPMRLRRIDGQWKLDLLHYTGAGEEALPDQIALLRAVAEALSESAAELKEGKHAGPPEAQEAIATRLRLVMLQNFARSTTRPQTQPTTQP